MWHVDTRRNYSDRCYLSKCFRLVLPPKSHDPAGCCTSRNALQSLQYFRPLTQRTIKCHRLTGFNSLIVLCQWKFWHISEQKRRRRFHQWMSRGYFLIHTHTCTACTERTRYIFRAVTAQWAAAINKRTPLFPGVYTRSRCDKHNAAFWNAPIVCEGKSHVLS